MADQLLAPWLNIARLRTDYRDNTGLTNALYTGAPETTGFGGDRLRLSLEFTPVGTSSTQVAMERATLRAFLVSLRGRQRRAILWDPQYLGPRGAFKNFTGELLTNNTFANDTTGWGVAAGGAIAVQDRVMRHTVTTVTGAANPSFFQAVAGLVQYAPYVARAHIQRTKSAGTFTAGAFLNNGIAPGTVSSYVEDGMSTVSAVSAAGGTADGFYVLSPQQSGFQAGDFIDVSYTSFARCALVDNGLNALLRSDELANAAWTPTGLASRTSDVHTAPDGTVTADKITEDGANSQHLITQSVARASVAADICSYGYFARSVGTRNLLLVAGNDSSNYGTATFDLGAGTILVAASTAGTATNARAFIKSAGNGYYFCCVVARLPAAATMNCFAEMCSGTAATYTGDGTSALAMWRLGICVSSVPTRGAQTVASALASGAVQAGNGLYLKGLPPTTAGLLRIDDRFEVITNRGSELKIVTAQLDSDAAGLGYVQFEPPLIGTPADSAPFIVHNPMTRAIFAGEMVGWEDTPGMLTTASAEFEEAA